MCRCVKARESFHSRRTKPLTLPGRNQARFSRSCGACAFHSFLSLSPLSFWSLPDLSLKWFSIRSVPLFPLICFVCQQTDLCLCVCGLSCLDLAITLCFAEEIPAVCVTLFATGLSPEHVCFIRAQWLPVDASVAWQKFRAQLDGHIRWRQISPRDAVLARRFCS